MSRARRRRLRPEAPRDQTESAFTSVLRRLYTASPAVLSVTFVDGEGETVDYCSGIDPFEAKVIGAQLQVTSFEVVEFCRRSGFGAPHEMSIYGEKRDLHLRRVGDHYALAIATNPGGLDRIVLAAVEKCVDEIRREAMIEVPEWEPRPTPLEVFVRESDNWRYAPALFQHGGEWTEVTAVLGRWIDEEEGGLVCFRVRARGGLEVTLAHDAEIDRWTLLTETWL